MMNNQEIEQHIVDHYLNTDEPLRKDDQEKIHNLIKDLHWNNGYQAITFAVKYLEMIKGDRTHE